VNPEPTLTTSVRASQPAESSWQASGGEASGGQGSGGQASCGQASCGRATLTRRALLSAGAAVAGTAGVAALAGCSKGLRGANGRSAATASAAPGTVLAKVSDVPVGNALSATMGGDPILISQPTAGTIVTFSAICTHQGCTVAPAGKEFRCPCHGSVYDAATGAVLQGPAPAPLAKIPTHVANGDVVAGA
jgi:Rieske Fe-S protein